MLELENIFGKSYSYTFVADGIKERSRVFASREAANQHMYKLCRKHNLQIKEVWNDKHNKTYCCNSGVKFFIHRSF